MGRIMHWEPKVGLKRQYRERGWLVDEWRGGKQGYRQREGNVTLPNQRRWRKRGSRKGQRNGDDGKMGF